MHRISRLNIWSFAIFQAVLFALIGLLAGILYGIGGLIIDALVSLGWLDSQYWETPGLSYGSILALGALLGMPLISAGIGFATGAIEAILYNLLAKRFGGISLKFS